MSENRPSATIGGFKDARAYREEALSARSYGRALFAEAMADERIVALTADLTQPTETWLFRDRLPDRFFQMGIAEANMVGAAGGMARCGEVPFAHSFCVFITRRVYDQIAIQAAYPNLPVKLVGFIAGLTTELGVTHQAIDDIALMRALPNMAVIEPCGPEQVGAAVRAALDWAGPVYLRMQMALGKPDETTPLASLSLGKGRLAREGEDAAILASGVMVGKALEAAQQLADKGLTVAVADMASLKPFDADLAVQLARRCGVVVTAENHSVIGGLGAATAEALALAGVSARFGMIGVQDVFAEGGTTPYLFERYGLSAEHIAQKVLALRGG